jgi:gluconate 2-dehydrogenase alpha chain
VKKTLKSRQVVFVGGGLMAGLAARQLVNDGIDVLVLERGRNHDGAAEHRLPSQRDELRWGVRNHLAQDWSIETYTLRYSRDETALPIRTVEAFLPGMGVGGAGNHWNGQCFRWAEYDPQLRTRLVERYGAAALPRDVPIQDWGVTYQELEPYHEAFEKLFGIAGKAGNLRGQIQPGGNPFEAPRQSEYPQPPIEITEAGVIVSEAAAKLGYKPFPMAAANSPKPYVNPDGMHLGACQYCGHCERFICESNAKGSPETLLYPVLRRKSNFEIRPFSHVLGLDYDRRAKRVKGVRYLDLQTGDEIEQPADVVVLSAFTFTNTRLLLAAHIGEPYDPATRRGVVGRNFCHQTNSSISVFYKDRWINPFLASGSSQTILDEFNGDNFDHSGLGFVGGAYIFNNTTNGRPISTRPLPPGTPPWGTKWKQANADWYAHAFTLGTIGSCYPHVENYLSLDPTYRDAYGEPLLRITFDWRENEVKMSDYVTRKALEVAQASGATLIGPAVPRKPPYDSRLYQTTHVVGGTPMGADPHTSVVSPHLQHWNAENLFVVGGSVYPHNAGYNPTGLMAAIGLRLADDLSRYAQRPQRL